MSPPPHPTVPPLPSSSLVPPSWLFSIWWLRGNPSGGTAAGVALPHLGLWIRLPLMAPELQGLEETPKFCSDLGTEAIWPEPD